MSRHPDDYYCTPTYCVDALCGEWPWGARIPAALDPCAGTGAILRALAEFDVACRGVELDPGRAAEAGCECGDGLAADWRGLDVVMNPPYRDAEAWVRKGLDEARSMAAFLPLCWLASAKRHALFVANPPRGLLVMSDRPSFTADGRTAAADYAWLLWGDVPHAARLAWARDPARRDRRGGRR